ncbi:SDR family oxidoreductase [Adhaeretor mobilis]|uniref:Putative oxidoreductase n=1 Tax=Adhaeretor mobilis TaxID=1930276 RepID=A0A517MVM8_9BACT|nr:SDR family oxidoreductase [Adhaeretor mobilis]QDS98934.1 putative oxidoreductase [Adhaeretor mobilis]
MLQRLIADSRVILTGASSGIGAALARALAKERARLILVARRHDRLEQLAEECEADSTTSIDLVVGDVTDPKLRERAIATAQARWGGLDLLINNAGVSAHGKFEDNASETFRQIMEVNLFAAAELTRLAVPLLRIGRTPAIVNVSSILGHRGAPLNSEYSASKFALRGWSEALRAELASDGIDVMLVSPGTTDTPFFDHLLEKQAKLPWGSSKGIPPEAVAAQIVTALRRRRREIFPNWRGRLLVTANRLAPGLVDRIMKKYGRAAAGSNAIEAGTEDTAR